MLVHLDQKAGANTMVGDAPNAWKTFDNDREYLENKYHKADEPFDTDHRFLHRNEHGNGYEFDPATGLSDEEMDAGLEALYVSLRGVPHSLAKARAVEFVLDHTRIDVNPQDYFIGIYSWGRVIQKPFNDRWHQELFSEILPEETRSFVEKANKACTMDIYLDYEHSVPSWDSILTLGFRGILERAEQYREKSGPLTAEQAAFFDSIIIVYSAVLRFIDRVYQYALTQTHGKAAAVAACLKRLYDGGPQNTYDVMQQIFLYYMVSETIEGFQTRSLAHGLDGALYPYYKQDIENGTYTEEELKELIAYFYMQYSAMGGAAGQPLYMGGTSEQGESLINDASYALLEVFDRLGIFNPKLQIKVNENTPQKILDLAMDMIRRGHNSLVFFCEPGSVKAMMSQGLTYTEARTCDLKGCYDMAVRDCETSTMPIWLNDLKPMSLVFSNGYDRLSGETVGLQTGDVAAFKSFDEFYHAFIAQYEYVHDGAMKAANSFEAHLDYVNPAPLYSGARESSLQMKKDGYTFGSKYNNTAILHTGFASAVDSLMAVKHLVFDKKLTTLAELKRALEQDWEGYETLRNEALRCPHKFGNNDLETDRYANGFSRYICMKENMMPNGRGGYYKSAMHGATRYLNFGFKTEATPDGRKLGDELSKNVSPVMGMDKEGVTALIHSVMTVEPSLYTEDFALDVMLHSSATEGADGIAAMNSVLRTYMQGGGLAIQFNVFNVETLHDAKQHPEKYKNLSVRVCGWNVLWSNLSSAEQDSYILRCENIR